MSRSPAREPSFRRYDESPSTPFDPPASITQDGVVEDTPYDFRVPITMDGGCVGSTGYPFNIGFQLVPRGVIDEAGTSYDVAHVTFPLFSTDGMDLSLKNPVLLAPSGTRIFATIPSGINSLVALYKQAMEQLNQDVDHLGNQIQSRNNSIKSFIQKLRSRGKKVIVVCIDLPEGIVGTTEGIQDDAARELHPRALTTEFLYNDKFFIATLFGRKRDTIKGWSVVFAIDNREEEIEEKTRTKPSALSRALLKNMERMSSGKPAGSHSSSIDDESLDRAMSQCNLGHRSTSSNTECELCCCLCNAF